MIIMLCIYLKRFSDDLIMNKLKAVNKKTNGFIDCANAEKWKKRRKNRMRTVMLKR